MCPTPQKKAARPCDNGSVEPSPCVAAVFGGGGAVVHAEAKRLHAADGGKEPRERLGRRMKRESRKREEGEAEGGRGRQECTDTQRESRGVEIH